MSTSQKDTEFTRGSPNDSTTVDETVAIMSNFLLRVNSSSSDDANVPVKEVQIIRKEPGSPREEVKEEASLIHEAGNAFQTMMSNLVGLAEELEIKELGKDCSGAAFSMVESLTNPGRRIQKSYHKVDTSF
jgi:hypothetical protein